MIRHVTLTAGAVASVDLTAEQVEQVQVIKRTTGGELWIRLDGTDPVAEANDVEVLPDAMCETTLNVPDARQAALTVKLLSTAALKVTVKANPR